MAEDYSLSSLFSESSDDASTSDEEPKTKVPKKTGPKPIYMDPSSKARRERSKKSYRKRMQTETEEERLERIASRREYYREYYQNETPEHKEERLRKSRKGRTNEFYKEYYQKLLMTETEEARQKRIESKRQHQIRKMMSMTEEELAAHRAQVNERNRKRIREETEVERQVRLERKKENRLKRTAKETYEEYKERRKLTNERNKERRKNETPEQRQIRLEKSKRDNEKRKLDAEKVKADRERGRKRWHAMSEEKKAKKREQARLAGIRRRRNETPEQRARRLEIGRRCVQRKKMSMTEAERLERIERERQHVANLRKNETEEEREDRLRKYREYNQNRPAISRRNGTKRNNSSDDNVDIRELLTKRPCRSAKATAIEKIGQQVEDDDSTGQLSGNGQEEDAHGDDLSACAGDTEEKVNGNEASPAESGSVMNVVQQLDKLKMKAVVVLERICLSHLKINVPEVSIKEESLHEDDAAHYTEPKRKKTEIKRKRKKSDVPPSARITRWFQTVAPSS